jgi:hypothetical protein
MPYVVRQVERDSAADGCVLPGQDIVRRPNATSCVSRMVVRGRTPNQAIELNLTLSDVCGRRALAEPPLI